MSYKDNIRMEREWIFKLILIIAVLVPCSNAAVALKKFIAETQIRNNNDTINLKKINSKIYL